MQHGMKPGWTAHFEWQNGSHTCFHRPFQTLLQGLVVGWSPGLGGDKLITKLVKAHYSRLALEPGIMLGCMHSTALSEYAAGNVAAAAPLHSSSNAQPEECRSFGQLNSDAQEKAFAVCESDLIIPMALQHACRKAVHICIKGIKPKFRFPQDA